MDARRFDAITRTWTEARRASRRRVLTAVPVLAAASGLAGLRIGRAFDGGDEPATLPGVACTGAADCPAGQVCVNGACQALPAAGGQAETTPAPETTPEPAVTAEPTPVDAAPTAAPTDGVGSQVGATQPLPAGVFSGLCGQLGADAAIALIEAGVGLADAGEFQGAPTALPARFSTTVIDVALADLLAAPNAIEVRVTANDPATALACGDVGGQLLGQIAGSELAIGLPERNGSGWSGIAYLRSEGEGTVVNVFVAQGLGGGAPGELVAADVAPPVDTGPSVEAVTEEAPVVEVPAEAAETPAAEAVSPEAAGGFAMNATIVTTAEVNLRAAPSTAAAVVGILPADTELTITAPPADGWLPVRDPATGRRGYVTEEFVVLVQ